VYVNRIIDPSDKAPGPPGGESRSSHCMAVADAGRAFDMVSGGEIGRVAIKFLGLGRPCQHGWAWARSQVRVVPQTGKCCWPRHDTAPYHRTGPLSNTYYTRPSTEE
jgi:hypothetical protein